MITFLYSLWIAYTVGSLSIIVFLVIFSILANYEKKKFNKKLSELIDQEHKDED